MTETAIPDGYWSKAEHHYFRDHSTMSWGVVSDGVVIIGDLDKSVAAAVACLLNGDVALARLFLDGLPDKLGGC